GPTYASGRSCSSRRDCAIGDAALKLHSFAKLMAALLVCAASAYGQDVVPPIGGPAASYPSSAPNPPAPAVEINPATEPAVRQVENTGGESYAPQPRRF